MVDITSPAWVGTYTLDALLSVPGPPADSHVYIVKAPGGIVVYIGITERGVAHRLRQHVRAESPVGRAMADALREPAGWSVEILRVRPRYLRAAELRYIREFEPRFNAAGRIEDAARSLGSDLGSHDWRALVEAEPRLATLRAEIEGIRSGREFCANELWMGPVGFKPRVTALVGWRAELDDPSLRTSAAYEMAYRTLYALLPDCQHRGACRFRWGPGPWSIQRIRLSDVQPSVR